jgi:hypothetical protein
VVRVPVSAWRSAVRVPVSAANGSLL